MQIADIGTTYASRSISQLASTASDSTTSANDSATNDFMLMLLAQLTNQNPLEPLKDSEMLSQFAQLNSVQELKDIHALMDQFASANQTGYAASLLGKTISASQDNGDTLEGVVTGISLESGKIYVHVGDEKALLGNVVEIKDS